MATKYKVLVLTDHRGHSDQNSIYEIVRQMIRHPRVSSIHIASRFITENDAFFQEMDASVLYGSRVQPDFSFTEDGKHYTDQLRPLSLEEFDMVFLRLPRPISDDFLVWLETVFPMAVIVNKPSGILQTSSKQFLTRFPDVCPDIRLCFSIDDIREELAKFPIVLKPLKEYGGKGIIKLNGEEVDDGKQTYDLDAFLQEKKEYIETEGYLSMKFLKNVDQGDKRILVVAGEILASSLRIPKEGSWLCNIAQGGQSVSSDVTDREKEIIERISPVLREAGILIFGADTLVDDDGQRILSEINTLSIGGFPQAEEQTGKPVIKILLDKMFEYADEQK